MGKRLKVSFPNSLKVMKRLLFITSVLLLCIICQGQKKSSDRHVSLADCGGDTLRYIEVNFLQNKDRYIGLKMDSLFKDLEIPIKYFGPISTRYNKVNGMALTYLSGNERDDFKKTDKIYYYIYITFEEPYTVDEDVFYKLGGAYWREKHRNFFKDFVIKDFFIWVEPAGKKLEK